jgi:hypothetical protein
VIVVSDTAGPLRYSRPSAPGMMVLEMVRRTTGPISPSTKSVAASMSRRSSSSFVVTVADILRCAFTSDSDTSPVGAAASTSNESVYAEALMPVATQRAV